MAGVPPSHHWYGQETDQSNYVSPIPESFLKALRLESLFVFLNPDAIPFLERPCKLNRRIGHYSKHALLIGLPQRSRRHCRL